MGEPVFFRNLTTKGLTAVNTGERYFEGFLTVQVKDKQGEVTIVDELMKVLPVWIDRGAPISDTHSNRIIGKGINYSKVEYKDKDGEIYPAIKVTGKIHKNYELDNDIWQKIKSGEYKGLSFGGATKSDREPMRMKDGSIAYSLKDLEHYEVAVCRDPAVPLALITEFNTLAKAAVDGQDLGDGRMLIKCDKFGCYVDKGEKQHQATDVELQQAMGNIKGQTELQNTTRRLGIGRGAARGRKPATEEPYKGYKTANSNEAGLKAPEASREALVYDDKTLDSVNQTPLENQAKLQKGEREHPSKEDSQAIIDGKVPGAFGDRNTDMYKKPTDLGKGQDWSNADGDRHSMYNQDTDEGGMGKKHTGPKTCKCGDPKCKDPKCKKHKREVGTGHGSEENNTADGWSGSGSPYPKKKAKLKDGYAKCPHCEAQMSSMQWIVDHIKEQHPESKELKETKKYDEDETKEDKEFHENWHKLNPSFPKKKKKKKKAIITNIHSRLKNLDTLYKKHVANKDPDIEQVSAEHATHNTPTYPKRTYEDQWDETLVIEDDGMGSKEGIPLAEQKIVDVLLHTVPANYKKPNKKKKAVITHVHSRLKNIQTRIEISNFLLRKTEEFGGMNTGETEWTEPRDTANSRKKRGKDVA